MILGLEKIIPSREMESGKFYVIESYDDEPKIVQCIKTGRKIDDIPEHKALCFTPGNNPEVYIDSLPDYGPVVELPDVHIRVDPPSIAGSSASTSLRSGMFFVAGQEALVTAGMGLREWFTINLSNGSVVNSTQYHDWISFSRWLLVMDDDGEEIPIASFGES